MFRILLLIMLQGQDPVTVYSHTLYLNQGACQEVLDGRNDDQMAGLLAQIELKLGHPHVLVACVEVNKGQIVPDV